MKKPYILLVSLAVPVLILASIYLYERIDHQQNVKAVYVAQQQQEDLQKMVRDNITQYVKAERNQYTYNKLGGIYNLKIAVSNTSNYLLDNVKVKVTYIKANGGIWKEKMIDFNLVEANQKVTLSIPDENRGVKIEYEIVSIYSAALGLARN